MGVSCCCAEFHSIAMLNQCSIAEIYEGSCSRSIHFSEMLGHKVIFSNYWFCGWVETCFYKLSFFTSQISITFRVVFKQMIMDAACRMREHNAGKLQGDHEQKWKHQWWIWIFDRILGIGRSHYLAFSVLSSRNLQENFLFYPKKYHFDEQMIWISSKNLYHPWMFLLSYCYQLRNMLEKYDLIQMYHVDLHQFLIAWFLIFYAILYFLPIYSQNTHHHDSILPFHVDPRHGILPLLVDQIFCIPWNLNFMSDGSFGCPTRVTTICVLI